MMALNHSSRNEIKMNSINEMSAAETYQATASIQLRTHPTHATINFSEMGKKLLESARNGDTEDVLELINTGAPFTTDWLGASPLHYAAQYGHVETVETLLRSGIAKDARTKIDRTALHVAAQEGFLDTVNVLVNYGCDVDAKDMLKMTPLHWAVQRGHREIIEVLLNHGADVKVINKFEKTPIDIAYSNGHSDYVSLLQNFKGTVKPKINPVDNTIPIRLMKTHQKNRAKTPNLNRTINKIVPNIKQEIIDEDSDMTPNQTVTQVDFKTIKRDSSITNGQIITPIQYQTKTSNNNNDNKIVINHLFKDQQNTSSSISNNNQNIINNSGNKKIYTNLSNIVVVSSNNSSTIKNDPSSGNGQIKVMSKKFPDFKNAKTFKVDNLNFPFFNSKQNSPLIKRYVIHPNNDETIKKLQDENNKLKRELEEYKSLIISKDLEIERLKKQKTNHNNNNSNNNTNNTTNSVNNNSNNNDNEDAGDNDNDNNDH